MITFKDYGKARHIMQLRNIFLSHVSTIYSHYNTMKCSNNNQISQYFLFTIIRSAADSYILLNLSHITLRLFDALFVISAVIHAILNDAVAFAAGVPNAVDHVGRRSALGIALFAF